MSQLQNALPSNGSNGSNSSSNQVSSAKLVAKALSAPQAPPSCSVASANVTAVLQVIFFKCLLVNY